MNRRRALRALLQAKSEVETILAQIGAFYSSIDSEIDDGYPVSREITGVTGAHVSDPTWAALQRRQRLVDLEAEAISVIERISAEVSRLGAVISRAPSRVRTDDIVRAARCSGAVDPTCTRIADGTRRRSGLCDRCWMVRYRAGA